LALGAFEFGRIEWLSKALPPLLPYGQREKKAGSEEDAVKGVVLADN
jgi:hypothetical protein